MFTKQLGLGSTNGADISASAAVDAQVSVDFVLAVTLGDSGHGAALGASAASDAGIVLHSSILVMTVQEEKIIISIL